MTMHAKGSRRRDGRLPEELRPTTIEPGWLACAEGSALIAMGGTRVLCAATVQETVPPFLQEAEGGWLTAEYRLLPASTGSRTPREGTRIKGRTAEIQRLVGRSLRAGLRLERLPPVTITIDCDVLEADGGTRTAAVTAGWVALRQALERRLGPEGIAPVLAGPGVTAVSVGRVEGRVVLDLPYEEDHRAEVDMNVVALGPDRLVEIQATGEDGDFSSGQLREMLDLALVGIRRLAEIQAATSRSRS